MAGIGLSLRDKSVKEAKQDPHPHEAFILVQNGRHNI